MRIPSSVEVMKPLLTPAQKAAGAEDAVVSLTVSGGCPALFPVEKALRAALLGQGRLLPVHLLGRRRLLGWRRLFDHRRWLFGTRWLLDHGLCFGSHLGFLAADERLLPGGRRFCLRLLLDFRLERRRLAGWLRRFDALGCFNIFCGALLFFERDARLLGRLFDRGWLDAPFLEGGGLAGYGDGFGVETLSQGRFDLPGRGDLHVLHHVHVGLQEMPEIIREGPLGFLQGFV